MMVSETANPDPKPFAPIRAANLVGIIRDEVREAILQGAYSSGDALRDSVVATEMGLSRAPVREALRLLEQSGLLEKEPNRPYRVKVFTRDDVSELAVLRIAFETTAVRIVVATKADVSEVHTALSKMKEVWESHSDYELNWVDLRFHRSLIAATGVYRLLTQYDQLIDQMILAWLRLSKNVTRQVSVLEEHDQILSSLDEAIASGSSTITESLLTNHIKQGMGCSELLI